MTLLDMKMKVLAMIEEYNPQSEVLTDDPDIATKINEIINQVMFELARIKKIAKYGEMEVQQGDVVTLADLEKVFGNEVYQIDRISGPEHVFRANGTVVKFLESGTAEIDAFVYPERITEKTKDAAYEFTLAADVLEIMPYGVAADLLKSDVSAEYGSVYASRFESMLQRLDPRSHMSSVTFEGGVAI